MPLFKQSDFSYGVVDETLHSATDAPQYLQALSQGDNVTVTSQRTLTKRGALKYVGQIYAIPAVNDVKSIGFETVEGNWYQAIFFVLGLNLVVHIIHLDNEQIIEAAENTVVAFSGNVNDISLTTTNDYIVVCHESFHPKRITITPTLTSFTVQDIDFAVVPSIDFNDVDYSSYTFTPGGSPLGSTITVHNPAGAPGFTSAWVGGLIIDEFGVSPESPLAYGLITSVGAPLGNDQTLTVTVLTTFSSSVSSGNAVSVRRPVWGTTQGYPRLCSFYQNRLWFGGTKALPLLVAGSKANQPNNFNVGTGQPPDAIVYMLSGSTGGGIKKLFGGQNLHIWTAKEQFIVPSGLDVGVTPGSFEVHKVSSYSISDMEPLLYRDNIYFTTSDGKALIEVQEQRGQAASVDLSFSASSLINGPKKAQINLDDDTQEQYLYLLNSDNTITAFSKSSVTGVNGFTKIMPSLPVGCLIKSFDVVDNKLFCLVHTPSGLVCSCVFSGETHLDCFTQVSFSSGTATTPNIYSGEPEVDIISIDGSSRITYYGHGVALGTTLSKPGLADGNYFIGKRYSVTVKSMPLFLSRNGMFYKKKIHETYSEYYKSYNFTMNGKAFALSKFSETHNPPVPKTGIARSGNTDGFNQESYITIEQNSPYPLTIKSIGWVISAGGMQ